MNIIEYCFFGLDIFVLFDSLSTMVFIFQLNEAIDSIIVSSDDAFESDHLFWRYRSIWTNKSRQVQTAGSTMKILLYFC